MYNLQKNAETMKSLRLMNNEILIMKSLRVSQLCVLPPPSQCYCTAWVYEIVMVNLANIFKMLNRIKLNSRRLLSVGASDIYIYISGL